MNSLSGDESIVLYISLLLAVWLGYRFIAPLLTTSRSGASTAIRLLFLATAVGCLLLIYLVISRWADPQVRDHTIYVILFLLAGAAWLGIIVTLLPVVGISYRDDALAGNRAATIVVCGAMLGTSLCYAGCNIGGGQTIWSTILPALLASTTLLLLWFGIELIGRFADAVAIDRDTASALRLAGWIIGSGAILGRAMAGDYISAGSTLRDFARAGWPAAALAVAAVILQSFLRPTPTRPKRQIIFTGCMPALLEVGIALAWIVAMGPWVLRGGAP